MSRRRAIALLAGAGVAAATHPVYSALQRPTGDRPAPMLDALTRSRLDRLFAELADRPDVRGAIASIETLDGSARWERATGLAHVGGEEIRTSTPFFLASIGKLFTATAALRLRDRGLLELDDPVLDHLPSDVGRSLIEHVGRDRSSRITLRHLLAHSSGVADYFTERPRSGGGSYVERLATGEDFGWSVEQVMAYVAAELDPHFEPARPDDGRSRIRYSDTNYHLAGAVLESAVGAPLHQVFEEEIFGPLALDRSYLHPHRRTSAHEVPASLWLDGRPWDVPLALASVGATGGVVSTLGDASTFLRALVTGNAFAPGSDALQLLMGGWNRFGIPLDRAALQLPGWPIEYGLGAMRFRLPIALNRFRSMPPVLGHTGSTGSWLFYSPDLRLILAGTVNDGGAGALPYRFLPRVLSALAQENTV